MLGCCRPTRVLAIGSDEAQSTDDFQDRATSRQWQLDGASELVAARGRIVAEYFEIGHTRRLAWQHRPQASALLAR